MISEMIGKETVEVNTQNVSRGNGGSTTTNTSYIERDLMQASEVGRMGRDRALVLFSNAAPLRDSKYPTQRHPRYELLAGHPGSRYPGRFDYGAYLQERSGGRRLPPRTERNAGAARCGGIRQKGIQMLSNIISLVSGASPSWAASLSSGAR